MHQATSTPPSVCVYVKKKKKTNNLLILQMWILLFDVFELEVRGRSFLNYWLGRYKAILILFLFSRNFIL